MCYSDDARVPLPPVPLISGAAADQGDLVLTSSDGTKFGAYFARAEKLLRRSEKLAWLDANKSLKQVSWTRIVPDGPLLDWAAPHDRA